MTTTNELQHLAMISSQEVPFEVLRNHLFELPSAGGHASSGQAACNPEPGYPRGSTVARIVTVLTRTKAKAAEASASATTAVSAPSAAVVRREIHAGSPSDPQQDVPSRGKRWPEEAAGKRSHETARYLISFDDGAMTFPEEEMPDVAEAAHKVAQEAKNAACGFSAAAW